MLETLAVFICLIWYNTIEDKVMSGVTITGCNTVRNLKLLNK